ncbi:HAD family hydrolase [Bacillus sp. FJAT-27916]|uniref:HAD-IIA family hydrolase n=1 Tax=Bacillus sp. FJAT-27916 TaxID=1679169 RepID=UPI0006712791|nr:HAD-IIA family hydrolase [Bacillus sp. FJAT-27916]KMY45714.1 HAD family hydrolase [Bacillus sp. FJAT-27916]
MRGYIFDLDGTVYLGDELIDGAKEAIAELQSRGDQVVFLTNKSIATRMQYVEKLRKLGIPAELDQVINSNFITAKYLKSMMQKQEAVLVIGEKPLVDELTEMGIQITENEKEARYVVIGWDRQFNYEKINKAYQAWLNKAKIIATNPDRTCPVDGGEIPDCGAMIGALEGATGQPIDSITGKPSRLMAEFVVTDVLMMNPSDCFMIGDRLETDIKMGNEFGLKSVLVLTGITTREMLGAASFSPAYVVDSIKQVPAL